MTVMKKQRKPNMKAIILNNKLSLIIERNMTMNESKLQTKDPICGMNVDEATALHAERDGKTFYFCSDHCKQKFLSTPGGVKAEKKSGGCCG